MPRPPSRSARSRRVLRWNASFGCWRCWRKARRARACATRFAAKDCTHSNPPSPTLIVDAPIPAARPAAQPIGVHVLRSGRVAVGVGLPFGHSDAEALQRLVAAARRFGASGLRTAPGRALLMLGPCADNAAARLCRRSGSARLHRRSRRSAPPRDRLRRRADLRLGRNPGPRHGAGGCAGALRHAACSGRGSCLRLRQRLRASGPRAGRDLRPRWRLRRGPGRRARLHRDGGGDCRSGSATSCARARSTAHG